MKRFLIQIALLCAALLATMTVAFVSGRDMSTYFAVVIDKEAILAQAPSPKIVLIGGSNVAYGIDAALMASSTGRETVNMGVATGLGLRYMLTQAAEHLRPGDTAIISAEYAHFDYDLDGDKGLFPLVLLYPAGIRHFTTVAQYVNVLNGIPYFFQQRMKSWLTLVVHHEPYVSDNGRWQFDQWGDEVGHLGQPQQQSNYRLLAGTHETAQAIALMNDFATQMQARGVKTYFAHAPFSHEAYALGNNAAIIQTIDQQLHQNLHFPILTTLNESLYDAKDFFNVDYHLAGPARRSRTLLLIDRMKKL